ncbi:MAG: membrane protein insertion efficiency factor YidD [Candidatus Hydrogenedentes bacterium]|nr:membrane protein insertion efficiency factor YidD [Candidatus Hydrogenedentota bacterium]
MRSILIAMIRIYQRFISPLLGEHCRFEPSCSRYAIESLEQHGLFKGIGLATWRLLRCQPFCKGGYDPVPSRTQPMKAKHHSGPCGRS